MYRTYALKRIITVNCKAASILWKTKRSPVYNASRKIYRYHNIMRRYRKGMFTHNEKHNDILIVIFLGYMAINGSVHTQLIPVHYQVKWILDQVGQECYFLQRRTPLWCVHTDRSDSYSAFDSDDGSTGMYRNIIGIGHSIWIGQCECNAIQ